MLLFNMPVRRAEELDQLFIDDIAFGMHWREFAAAILKEWHDTSMLVRRDRPTPSPRRTLLTIESGDGIDDVRHFDKIFDTRTHTLLPTVLT